MDSRFIPIELTEDLPFRLRTVEGVKITNHWHSSIELAVVISGEVTLIAEGKVSQQKKGDIFIVNYENRHCLMSRERFKITSLQLPYDYLNGEVRKIFPDIHYMRFSVSGQENRKRDLEELKQLYQEILNIYIEKKKGYQEKLKNYVLNLVRLLINKWQAEEVLAVREMGRNNAISRIVQYIDDNYCEPVNLDDLSNFAGYSKQYIAKMFKSNMNMTVKGYLNLVRLQHAYHDLVTTDKSINYISDKNGFSNVASFNEIFRETYHMLPKEFQKSEEKERELARKGRKFIDGQNSLGYHILDSVEALLSRPVKTEIAEKKKGDLLYFTADAKGQKESVHYDRILVVPETENKDILKVGGYLRKCSKDIKFQYVFLPNLLETMMEEIWEGAKRKEFRTRSRMDILLDEFAEAKIPIQLYLGRKTAENLVGSLENKERMIKIWFVFCQEILKHFIQRYGIETVKKWKFVTDGRRENEYMRTAEDVFKKLHLENQIIYSGYPKEMEKEDVKANDSYESARNTAEKEVKALMNREMEVYHHFIDESRGHRERGEFIGAHGIVTKRGIKKASCYALEFVSRLGGQIILQKQGCVVGVSEGKYGILLYDVKRDHGKRDCVVRIEHVIPGIYREKIYMIDRFHGSSYEIWKDMGSPELGMEEERNYIERKSLPRLVVKKISCKNVLEVECGIEENGLCFIELELWEERNGI
jgi:AraC-like DNA-binding protein/beta-xylosidase